LFKGVSIGCIVPSQLVSVRTGIPELTPGNYNLPRLLNNVIFFCKNIFESKLSICWSAQN